MTLLDSSPISVEISQELNDEFTNHVLKSCLCPKVMTYFSTGIAEECAEFLDIVNLILKENTEKAECEKKLDPKLMESALSEAGDIMWYMYALSFSLPGGLFYETLEDENIEKIQHSSQRVICIPGSKTEDDFIENIFKDLKSTTGQKLNDLKNSLCSSMGKLCGSVKKFSRGDKNWDVFYKRIQQDVNNMLLILANNLLCLSILFRDDNVTLENAMLCNIQKIAQRMSKGTIKGDGEVRWFSSYNEGLKLRIIQFREKSKIN